MPEVQEILEQYGENSLQKHRLSFVQRKAWNAIRNCRTARLGGHLDKCPNCGFLSSRGKKKKLKAAKYRHGQAFFPREKLSAEQLIQKLIGRKPTQCPRCGYSGLLRTGLAPPAV